jgi:acyl-CoA thioesterase FadM
VSRSPAFAVHGVAPLFTTRFHVSMGDVDAAMILFYATPMHWAERVLSQWRRDIGQSVSSMLAGGSGSPVVHAEVDYLRPMRLDDEVEATLWLGARSPRSYTLICRFAAGPGGPVGAQVSITMVWVEVGEDGAMHSAPVPPEMVAALEAGAG